MICWASATSRKKPQTQGLRPEFQKLNERKKERKEEEKEEDNVLMQLKSYLRDGQAKKKGTT